MAGLTGKVKIFIRWGITLMTILIVMFYQLGVKASPAGFNESEQDPEPKTVAASETETADKQKSADGHNAVSEQEAASGTDSSEETLDPGPWADGTYEGTAEGYGGPVTVEVVIANGWISDITIIDASGEDQAYLRDARKIIPKVIAGQSTDLDAISGATTTSWAILDAIDYAMEDLAE